MVRLIYRPDIIIAVYRGRKPSKQQQPICCQTTERERERERGGGGEGGREEKVLIKTDAD